MSDERCTRWMSLADREALGEALPAEDRAFFAEHPETCDACREERSVFHSFSGVLETADETPLPAEVQAVIAKAPRPIRIPRSAWAPMALAAAAALLLAFLFVDEAPDAHDARFVIARGALRIAGGERGLGTELERGMGLRAGSDVACLRIDGGVDACFDDGAEASVADTNPRHRRLHLARGRLVARLPKQAEGSRFSISTPDGVVTVVGTLFAVEAGPPSVVRVLEGTVLVEAPRRPGVRVGAGETLVIGETATQPVAPAQALEDRQLLDAEPAVVVAPVSPPRAPVAPARAPATAEPPVKKAAPVGTAADLLSEARELKASGRFADAARYYRMLQARHPGTPEAQVSLVSLGELQLGRLADARGALRSFDAYLSRGGGSLAQEARHGRIRALQALGRADEERRAIEAFLADFPSSFQARTLRERLTKLGH